MSEKASNSTNNSCTNSNGSKNIASQTLNGHFKTQNFSNSSSIINRNSRSSSNTGYLPEGQFPTKIHDSNFSIDNQIIPFIYGSQTGNAEAICQSLVDDAINQNILARCYSMCDIVEQCGDKDTDLAKQISDHYTTLVFVVSSTGNGDPPDNAAKFQRKLRRLKKKNVLSNVYFTVLGLGDTNYDKFGFMPIQLDAKLLELGAHRFYERGLADDAVGLEQVVEPQREGLFPALLRHVRRLRDDLFTQTQTNPLLKIIKPKSEEESKDSGIKIYNDAKLSEQMREASLENSLFPSRFSILKPPSQANIVMARLHAARHLTSKQSEKQVLHIELDLGNESTDSKQQAGDSVCFYCPNDRNEVEELLRFMDWDGDMLIKFNKSNRIYTQEQDIQRLYDLLLYLYDLRTSASTLRKSYIKMLIEACKQESDKTYLEKLLKPKGKNEYLKFLSYNRTQTLVDFLSQRAPSCKLSPLQFIEHNSLLKPRHYSIASANLPNTHSLMHFALTIVDFSDQNVKGVCTRQIHNLCKESGLINKSDFRIPNIVENGDIPLSLLNGYELRNGRSIKEQESQIQIPISFKLNESSSSFRMPTDLSIPLIMVGPGTGVSPFRGFLQYRRYLIENRESTTLDTDSIGKTILFFGCRTQQHDQLYEEDFCHFEEEQTLNTLICAYSRENLNENFKTYVQHKMVEHSKEIVNIIENNASSECASRFYVCGDRIEMAVSVRQTLIDILQKELHISNKEAVDYVQTMIAEKRYIQDIQS